MAGSMLRRTLTRGLVFVIAAAMLAPAQGRQRPPAEPIGRVAIERLPIEARQTLGLIKRGGPFPFRRDGVTFGNFERRLPARPRGYYHEYTVPTPGARDRGARRIVAGEGSGGDVRVSGEYYYSPDHYRSFSQIGE